MKTNIKKTGLFFIGMVILIAPFLCSCETDDKFIYVNDQINASNKRIAALEQSTEKNFTSTTSNQAAIRLEIDQLKKDISQLSGRVEESENIIKHSVEKDLTERDAIRTDVSGLSSRLDKIEMSVNQQKKYLNIDNVEQDSAAQGKTEAAPEPGEPAAAVQESGEKYLYDSSLAQYNDGQFNEAMTGFKKFLEEYPKSDLADNAQFWVGECLMSLREYEQAILAFQDVIKKYPKGNKVANAMLRQAIAWLEINDKTNSTYLLKKVIKQFPNSNEAKIAKLKLDTIK